MSVKTQVFHKNKYKLRQNVQENLISEFDFMHFKFCTVILIIKNNDSEDFWFQL